MLSYTIKAQANQMLGVGIGLDYVYPINREPLYADKDINISYSITWKYFSLEAREGLRYFRAFNNGLRSNSYFLIGFTTIKEKAFSFNLLIGGAFSFLLNKNENSIGQRYYFPQISPTIKSGFCFRLSEAKRIYLGLDALFSTYRYTYNTGSTGESGSITGSALISINFQLTKQSP